MANERGGSVCADFFFYGILLDNDIYTGVTGRSVAPYDRRPAIVDGYRRVFRQGASYPILIAAAGDRVEGSLVSKVGQQEIERLKAFEGHEYDLVQLSVHVLHRGPVRAHVFMAKSSVAGSENVWSLSVWRQRYKKRDLARLRAVPSGTTG